MTQEDITRTRTLHRQLKRQAERYGERTFFWFKDRAYSYLDFDRESDRVAAGLQKLGIGKGDKVGILLSNRPEYLFVWFGLSKLGAVEVPINTAHRGELLTYMFDQADCRLAVCEAQFLDRLAPVLDSLPKLEWLVLLDGVPDGLGKPALDYAACIANDGRFAPVDVRWSDPFAILFTSGTTGPSKGSLMPQNYALFLGEAVSRCMNYTPEDRLYNVLPLFHGNAQLLSTMAALMSGAQMVLGERFSASEFWPDVKKYGCTEFNYIGGILPILLKAEPRADDADHPLRVMMGAGAARDVFLAFESRFGVKLVEGYGMSEIGMPLMNRLDGERVPGSIGRPAFGCEVRLIDDEGLEITEPDVPGELLVRTDAPHTMLIEYYRMPDKTVEAWRDLWFHTGDYATRDAAGSYFFVDRKKDALRRRGENISSYEVESVINAHPAVLESAAVAIKSEIGEDEVMVCVTLKPGAELTPAALIDHCQTRMAYFMVPRYVRILTSLPKTPTEKIQKAELRKQGLAPDTWDREQAGHRLER